MSKDYVQALEDLFGLVSFQKSLTREQFTRAQEYCDIIEAALQRLEQIDNAKPSEAMECLNKMIRDFNETTTGMNGLGEVVVGNELMYFHKKELETIEQSLLKAQEQEKVLKVLMEKKVDIEYLSKCNNVKEYNSHWCNEKFYLTEEEFDLLKRWSGGKRI